MIENDSDFQRRRQDFYELHYREAEPIDPWHAYAQNVVHQVTRRWFDLMGKSRGKRVLNAGSGGSSYNITEPMVHLDLNAQHIHHFPAHLIGDISNIPAPASSYDVVICVGSVLNYANPVSSIAEFQRILCPGGLLILEYERSNSPEYWFKYGYSSPCSRVSTFYGKVKTDLWVYGDQFIDGLLNISDFSILCEERFHGVSSLILAAVGSPSFAAHWTWGDKWIANRWPFSEIASNRILAIEKLSE